MNVSVKKLIYDFVRKYNSQTSNAANRLKIFTVVSYLNEALEIWFENRVALFERDSEVRNALRNFEKKDQEIVVSRVDIAKYRFEIPADFYRKTGLYVKSTSDCCPDIVKEIEPSIIQTDDLFRARKSPYNQSSFKWERLLADEAGKHYYIYPEEGHTVLKAYLSYIKLPKYLQVVDVCEGEDIGYKDYDGNLITKNIDLEVDNTFDHRKITDIAILCATRDNLDSAQFQSQLNKIISTRNL